MKQTGDDLKEILEKLKKGELSVEEAELSLREEPVAELGYARVDLHRKMRQGMSEVIYGAGKTADQIAGILKTMLRHKQTPILVTRLDPEKYRAVEQMLGSDGLDSRDGLHFREGLHYHEEAKILIVGDLPEIHYPGTLLVACGGTSDIRVAEEAALTAEAAGVRVQRLYDVGVAGIHRLLSHTEDLLKADVIIACAGMEGALASVIGGLADCPVIAVPTSVGYGASFHGLSALLAMLNSCASGVTVVNIDNGFGAAMAAMKILRKAGQLKDQDL
jgi:NCAIR mutase (PurE)-related protein